VSSLLLFLVQGEGRERKEGGRKPTDELTPPSSSLPSLPSLVFPFPSIQRARSTRLPEGCASQQLSLPRRSSSSRSSIRSLPRSSSPSPSRQGRTVRLRTSSARTSQGQGSRRCVPRLQARRGARFRQDVCEWSERREGEEDQGDKGERVGSVDG